MNDENLIPMSQRSKSEVRQIGSKGGKASGKARREKRDLSDAMKTIMSLDNSDESIKKVLDAAGIEDKSNASAFAISLFLQALQGSTKAAELVMDLDGSSIKAKELNEKIRNNKANEKLREKELKQDTSSSSSNASPMLEEICIQLRGGNDV